MWSLWSAPGEDARGVSLNLSAPHSEAGPRSELLTTDAPWGELTQVCKQLTERKEDNLHAVISEVPSGESPHQTHVRVITEHAIAAQQFPKEILEDSHVIYKGRRRLVQPRGAESEESIMTDQNYRSDLRNQKVTTLVGVWPGNSDLHPEALGKVPNSLMT